MSSVFQRTLLGIFYSAMLLDVNLTLEFMNASGFLQEFFTTSFQLWKTLKLSYERKLFTLAMTNFLFNCGSMPEPLKEKAGLYMREVVCVLIRQ